MMKKSVQIGILTGFLVVLCLCGFIGNAARANGKDVEAGKNLEEKEELPPTPSEMDLEPENSVTAEIDSELLPERPTVAVDKEAALGEVYAADRPYLIGIDPGHLGYGYTSKGKRYFNTGAVSAWSGKVEYEFSLELARSLKEELVSRGYDVYLVRNTNVQEDFPYDYGQRSEAINQMECDIMVGIHWDSFDDSSVGGYHVIYQAENTDSYELASCVSTDYGRVVKGTIKRRSEPVGRSDLWELNAVTMPGIFIECGFASKPSEAKWLEDSDNQELMAQGIADGIDAYFVYWEEKKAQETEEEESNPAETETETTETTEKETKEQK